MPRHHFASCLSIKTVLPRLKFLAVILSNLVAMAILSPTILFIASLLASVYLWVRRRKESKLPPGPPRLPILGNLHQAPKEAAWVTYQKWVEQYGPLVYLNFGGTDVVLIGNHEVAKDLLDKKANIYSSRPRMVGHKVFGPVYMERSLWRKGYGTRVDVQKQAYHVQAI